VRHELRAEIDRRDPGRRVEPCDFFSVEKELDLGDAPLDRETNLPIPGGQAEKEG